MTRAQRPSALWHGHDASYWQVAWQAGEVRLYDVVGSTNDVVAQLAAEGAPSLSIAVAEEQTRGRGRGGSTWQVPSGAGLLFSVLFRAAGRGGAPGCAPIRLGLAICDAVEELTGARPGLKWPNDVVLTAGGKLAGILCEGVFGQRGSAHIVAGIGINVSQSESDFPPELRGRACSIASATGRAVDRAVLLSGIMRRFHELVERITEPLNATEMESFLARDVLRGQNVVCQMTGEQVHGVARGIADDGALLIEQPGGRRPIYSGTVRFSQTHSDPGGGQ